MKEIPLSKGKVALVDDEMFDEIARYKWYVMCRRYTSYAVRAGPRVNGRQRLIYMHRAVANALDGQIVDHVDGDGLNNTSINLRLCTSQQNQFNKATRRGSSRYKGVYWFKKLGKWRAQIQIGGKTRNIGFFEDECAAARAYDNEAVALFGQFAKLNF